MARPRKNPLTVEAEQPVVEAVPADTVVVTVPDEAASLPPIEREVPTLAAYIADVEGRHVARDVYAVEVAHPNGEERVYPGMYSGIRIKQGPMSVRYSDGTTE